MTTARDTVTIAVVNFHPEWGQSNLDRIRELSLAAAGQGAEIIVFPEMALTGYSVDPLATGADRMQWRLAETIPGPSTDAVCDTAKRCGAYILFGMPERSNNTVFNAAAIVTPEGQAFSYRKMHPFGRENSWCAKGKDPLILATPWGPVGIGVCYDSYQFPELVRYYAAMGCRLYINCTAQSAAAPGESAQGPFERYYLTTLAGHVITNEIFVASANLCGVDGNSYYPGASLILGPTARQPGQVDPDYRIYAGSLTNADEGIFCATVDLSLALRSPYGPNPATGEPDFRPDIYAGLYARLTLPHKQG